MRQLIGAHREQRRWHPLQPAGSVHAGERAVAGAEERGFAEEFVFVFELCFGRFNHLRAQRQQVVVTSRCSIAAIEFGDDEEQAPFFHRSIIAPLSAEEFRPTNLEVFEIIRVMQKAHRVSFGVADSELRLVLSHDLWCVGGLSKLGNEVFGKSRLESDDLRSDSRLPLISLTPIARTEFGIFCEWPRFVLPWWKVLATYSSRSSFRSSRDQHLTCSWLESSGKPVPTGLVLTRKEVVREF